MTEGRWTWGQGLGVRLSAFGFRLSFQAGVFRLVGIRRLVEKYFCRLLGGFVAEVFWD